MFYIQVDAWALGCFHSVTASVESCAEIKSAEILQQCSVDVSLSGVTNSGRVWIEEGAETKAMLGVWVQLRSRQGHTQTPTSFLQPLPYLVTP